MAFKGRYFMMTPGKRLHIRRGGGWLVRGGDACVALAGGERRAQSQDEGDASVPTNVTICPPKYLPLKGAEWSVALSYDVDRHDHEDSKEEVTGDTQAQNAVVFGLAHLPGLLREAYE